MSIGGYKIRNQAEVHFLTFTVVEWADVFTRADYCELLIRDLKYCQQYKGLNLHAWCLMSNHLHLLASSATGDLSALVRDFKKVSAKRIVAAIGANQCESRRAWLLRHFRDAAADNTRNSGFQFWIQNNCPQECFAPAFTVQKLNYIHFNPVKSGVVERPEHYRYSSARAYLNRTQTGPIEIAFL
ncbi:REP-associated tyrosine transposase [Flaviaesturariibacter amylovorans]|uniref:Transposase n=1 Tax=Flaviaesturariibacter amylovorans TaxID=1084520 RepID=A0ABP8G8Y3_9BACT